MPKWPVHRGTRPLHRHQGLGVLTGLSALSLDALTSVAYGPEAMVLVLVAAGAGAVRDTLAITLVIVGMLVLLIISYSQVIAAYPDGGGAYAVAKRNFPAPVSLLAAGALVVDYVLTVAVSLAAGAASLASAFPGLSRHLLMVSLIGLALLSAINMLGIIESAKVLLLPAAVFILSTLAVALGGLGRSHPIAVIGTHEAVHATEALGIVLLLKAFAAGCSAVTGVEAIANGAPSFKSARHAQGTELALGALLAVMLVGLSVQIHDQGILPRGGVTVLAQLTAGTFGKNWAFYLSNVSVALALGLAANTSFGGLPVLMNLLARDHRLPHMFYLRAEKPVYRHGIVALAIFSALLLAATGANTNSLIPMFAIGVFIGFTISQSGLVRHWTKLRPHLWQLRASLNGAGATMTAVATVVFLISKFTHGAWVVAVAVPLMMVTFARIESYYREVAHELKLGLTPPRPRRGESLVLVPTTTVNLLTERAISAALSLSETVVAVAVAGDQEECRRFKRTWDEWACSAPLEVVLDPHRSLVRSVVRYIDAVPDRDTTTVVVLIPEVVPRLRRHEILHNQRGRLLAASLRARTDVVVATLPFRLHEERLREQLQHLREPTGGPG
jgi:amino acid transporter